MSRMMRISTSETIMMVGALRLRTTKFIAWDGRALYTTGVGVGAVVSGGDLVDVTSREERP